MSLDLNTAAALATSLLVLYIINTWRFRRNILKDIPMPPGASLLWGHERTAFNGAIGGFYGEWLERIGPTYKIKAAGTEKDILVTVDPAAIHHIFTRNPYNYEHSPVWRPLISRLLGEGLVWVEGQAEHRRMRSVVAPAFTLDVLRSFSPVIWETGNRLQSRLEKLISSRPDGRITIDLTKWTSMATLDVIGKIALSYDFQFGDSPEAKAIFSAWRMQVDAAIRESTFFGMVAVRTVPWVTSLPVPAMQAQGEIKETVTRLAHTLLESSEEDLHQNKNLLSMLYNAQRQDEKKASVSTKEAIENICTFSLVGHETVAGVLAFTLHALATNPASQERLRDELLQNPHPTFDTLWSDNTFPYLAAVVREGLRLFPVAGHTEKVVYSDDVLPLKFPIPSADGKSTIDQIHVQKGQVIYLPLIYVDKLKRVWGPTAHEFRPERWLAPEELPNAEQRTNGYSGVFAFSEGPRMCVGWRLAVLELKAFISTVIRNFELHSTGEPMIKKFATTMQPCINGRESDGIQLNVQINSLHC